MWDKRILSSFKMEKEKKMSGKKHTWKDQETTKNFYSLNITTISRIWPLVKDLCQSAFVVNGNIRMYSVLVKTTHQLLFLQFTLWLCWKFLAPAIWINSFTNFGYISASTIELLGPGQHLWLWFLKEQIDISGDSHFFHALPQSNMIGVFTSFSHFHVPICIQ